MNKNFTMHEATTLLEKMLELNGTPFTKEKDKGSVTYHVQSGYRHKDKVLQVYIYQLSRKYRTNVGFHFRYDSNPVTTKELLLLEGIFGDRKLSPEVRKARLVEKLRKLFESEMNTAPLRPKHIVWEDIFEDGPSFWVGFNPKKRQPEAGVMIDNPVWSAAQKEKNRKIWGAFLANNAAATLPETFKTIRKIREEPLDGPECLFGCYEIDSPEGEMVVGYLQGKKTWKEVGDHFRKISDEAIRNAFEALPWDASTPSEHFIEQPDDEDEFGEDGEYGEDDEDDDL